MTATTYDQYVAWVRTLRCANGQQPTPMSLKEWAGLGSVHRFLIDKQMRGAA